ncbi:hypothetical protein GCK72_003523 [Caenorhabditis remanei]|uniref:C-type lectin domain-containing protein n=1 Tax=Caenorhabditis remanei TaxID=31234 RepID=A0A6A5HXE4_CAERE|nr:hypothetical protein GCK72_003523 [Caenorhabditis remanei]KAF1771696.1 hypothetical protein GCK72_003523 [Caenorhabditis remanei]
MKSPRFCYRRRVTTSVNKMSLSAFRIPKFITRNYNAWEPERYKTSPSQLKFCQTMNLLPLFSILLAFLITSTEAHRGRSRKDGRHDHFLSIEPPSSSSSSSSHDSSSDEIESTRGSGKRGHQKPRPPREPAEEKCQMDWLTFERPQGKWCVKLYNALIDQLSAEQRCKAIDATLTGLQTNEERMKLAANVDNVLGGAVDKPLPDAARALLLPTSVTDAAIWLGAKRKPECPRAGICFPKDTFNWTDGHTTGTDGFVYTPGEPNGKISAYGVQSCIHQIVFPRGPTHWFWTGVTHGELDDTWCQEATQLPTTKLYACGKKATR